MSFKVKGSKMKPASVVVVVAAEASISLCSPGYPEIPYVDQASLELTEPLCPTFIKLGVSVRV